MPADSAQADCAEETIHACREEASRIRQCGVFQEYARWLAQNANAAERWLAKESKDAG